MQDSYKTTMLKSLTYFVSERENIRLLREKGEASPWTEDAILHKYRFCNIRRCDDRVSKWIIDNIIEPHSSSDWLWIMLCAARYINWPPTIKELIDKGEWPIQSFSATDFGKVIDNRMKRGEKTWTGAYIITGRNIPKGMDKGYFIAKNMIEPLFSAFEIIDYFANTEPEDRSVETTMSLFKGIYGWGTFMVGQAVADMTYSPILGLAKDLHTFAPIGPGSLRGLNRIYDRPLEQVTQQDRFNDELMEVREFVKSHATVDVSSLTLHDWQNCMCEFDKYQRAQNKGRPRSNYTPEKAF